MRFAFVDGFIVHVLSSSLTDLVKEIVLPLVCVKSNLHTAIIKLILAC